MNEILNKKTKFVDLGLIDYKQAWDYQTNLFQSILDIKTENRANNTHLPTNNYLLFCEHPHVFTLGKSGEEQNLLVKKEDLHTIEATYYHSNRGGDITYHGPGQLVVYPVIDLENFFTDIHQYMRLLEESVIQTLREFNISAGRIKGLTGVWIDSGNEKIARKICALGVKTSRWVTLHGLAFNVNSHLKYFDYIVPCGIQDKAVTSLEKEKGSALDFELVKTVLKDRLSNLFEMEIVN